MPRWAADLPGVYRSLVWTKLGLNISMLGIKFQVLSCLMVSGVFWILKSIRGDANVWIHSVALSGPAGTSLSLYSINYQSAQVFKFTAPSSPSRHREALAIFKRVSASDSSISRLPDESVGFALYDAIADFLFKELEIPRGLQAIGYSKADIPRLVKGTIPQRRVLDLAPGIGDVAGSDGEEYLTTIITESMRYWKKMNTESRASLLW